MHAWLHWQRDIGVVLHQGYFSLSSTEIKKKKRDPRALAPRAYFYRRKELQAAPEPRLEPGSTEIRPSKTILGIRDAPKMQGINGQRE